MRDHSPICNKHHVFSARYHELACRLSKLACWSASPKKAGLATQPGWPTGQSVWPACPVGPASGPGHTGPPAGFSGGRLKKINPLLWISLR